MTQPQAAQPELAPLVVLDAGELGRTEWASAGQPYGAELNSGDRWVALESDGAALLAVIDGLGHGPGAYEAATRAVEVLTSNAGDGLGELVNRCHQAMLETRGAAMSLVSLRGDGQLTWLGVGNVAAHVVVAGPAGPRVRTSALLSAGIVGYRLPPAMPASHAVLGPDELLLLTTDGIADGHLDGIDLSRPVSVIAQDILARHGKRTDDAQVLLARQRSVR